MCRLLIAVVLASGRAAVVGYSSKVVTPSQNITETLKEGETGSKSPAPPPTNASK